MSRKFTDEQLRECVEQGMRAPEIAERFGCTRAAVWVRANRLAQKDSSFSLPHAHKGRPRLVSKADLLDVQHLDMTIGEAAEHFGVSYGCVRGSCVRDGVTLKGKNGPSLGNSVNTCISMPAPILDAVTKYAKEEGQSRSRVISRFVEAGLKGSGAWSEQHRDC